jgi:hypothetical protein
MVRMFSDPLAANELLERPGIRHVRGELVQGGDERARFLVGDGGPDASGDDRLEEPDGVVAFAGNVLGVGSGGRERAEEVDLGGRVRVEVRLREVEAQQVVDDFRIRRLDLGRRSGLHELVDNRRARLRHVDFGRSWRRRPR